MTVTPLKDRTIYFTGVNEHFQAVAAAYRAHGQRAEAMPLTTRESLGLGMQASRGRECLYFVINLGDILQRSRQGEFDPAKAAMFVPDISTKCVSVNFGTRLKEILAENGLSDLKIVTPVAGNDFEGFGKNFREISDLSWAGIVGVDLIQQLQQSIRPYEAVKGDTDATYRESLKRVVTAVESGSIDRIVEAVDRSGQSYQAIATDRSRVRTKIILVGEYLLYNEYLNLNLVRQVEALGGEVEINRYYKLFYSITLGKVERARNSANTAVEQELLVADERQRTIERRVVVPVRHLFTTRQPYAAAASEVRDYIKPHYNPEISNGAVDWAPALQLADHGRAHGVIQIVPFLCLGAIISASLGTRVRHDVGGIPWLELAFDAQGTTNVRTRLEAFMHQAAQFRRSGPIKQKQPVRLGVLQAISGQNDLQ